MANQELKVTKDRVVKAAASCGDAARVLKELFPEAFVDTQYQLDLPRDAQITLDRRNSGSLVGKGYFLHNLPYSGIKEGKYEWALELDSENETVLVQRLIKK